MQNNSFRERRHEVPVAMDTDLCHGSAADGVYIPWAPHDGIRSQRLPPVT